MATKKEKRETVGFNFQVITTQDAKSMLAAGCGLYSELKEELLARIPQLKEGEAFVFGMPGNSKLEKKEIVSLRASVNKTFMQTGIPWKIGYSAKRNLFIGDYVPAKVVRKNGQPHNSNYITQATPPPKMSAQAFVKIAKKLHPEFDFTQIGYPMALYRSAMSQIAIPKLGIAVKELAPLLNVSYDAVYYNARKGKPNKYNVELEEALKETNP